MAILGAFQRIITHPRITTTPLTAAQAQDAVDADLARRHHVTGNLVPDAQVAALALEYGVVVASADTDFARFPEVRWVNPLTDHHT